MKRIDICEQFYKVIFIVLSIIVIKLAENWFKNNFIFWDRAYQRAIFIMNLFFYDQLSAG